VIIAKQRISGCTLTLRMHPEMRWEGPGSRRDPRTNLMGPEVRERAGPRLPICLTQAPRAVLGGNGAGSVLAATPWGRGTDAASDTSSQFDELGATLLLMRVRA